MGAAAILAVSLVTAPTAEAAAKPDLAKLVTVNAMKRHLVNLKTISDYNGGNRKSGLAGYDISVKYVVNELKKAGLEPKTQTVPFWVFKQDGPGAFEQVAPAQQAYKADEEYGTWEYSGSGDVTANVFPVDLGGDQGPAGHSGCEAADFEGIQKGDIALIRRGTCAFVDKVNLAVAAGAGAVIIYQRQGPDVPVDTPAVFGLDKPAPIPVIGTTYKIGTELRTPAEAKTLQVRVKTEVTNTPKPVQNVIAESTWGDPNNVVVVGAHLDSVAEGPGINDNGSGSAAILTMAQNIDKLGKKNLKNKVRFAWWAAEESGLVGAYHYVGSLTPAQRDKIALNLNFDMLGSVNFARFVYDGDDSMGSGTNPPAGSGAIEKTFVDYFGKLGLKSEPTAFDGRSDYGPFIEVGIPAGGLFSGAEGIKTAEQVAWYGGEAGKAYDPCYHAACDTMKNIDWTGLDQMADAAAFATQKFAFSTLPVNGQARIAAKAAATRSFDWKGGRLVR
ncbi:M28 family peptidase [Spirillospora sp. NPDC047279]|uniref:M28 family peptidase n=1 Tax=Spirillospora sp. NPDC047279 TaxID=3155478 RepID=UPI003408677F